MKKLKISALTICIISMVGCSGAEINSLTEQEELYSSITFPKSNAGTFCNLYPEVDLSEICQLPVYKLENISKENLHNDIHNFANEFNVILDKNNSYIIESDNSIQYFSKDGTKIFTGDFLEFSMMDQIPDSDYYGVPCNIEYTYDALEDSIILQEYDKINIIAAVEQYLANSNIGIGCSSVEIDSIYRTNTIRSDGATDFTIELHCYKSSAPKNTTEILCDYYQLVPKLVFKLDFSNGSLSGIVISMYTTQYLKEIQTVDIIPYDEACQLFKTNSCVNYLGDTIHSDLAEWEVYLVYIVDNTEYIRPIYMCQNKHAIGRLYNGAWIDAIDYT